MSRLILGGFHQAHSGHEKYQTKNTIDDKFLDTALACGIHKQ